MNRTALTEEDVVLGLVVGIAQVDLRDSLLDLCFQVLQGEIPLFDLLHLLLEVEARLDLLDDLLLERLDGLALLVLLLLGDHLLRFLEHHLLGRLLVLVVRALLLLLLCLRLLRPHHLGRDLVLPLGFLLDLLLPRTLRFLFLFLLAFVSLHPFLLLLLRLLDLL